MTSSTMLMLLLVLAAVVCVSGNPAYDRHCEAIVQNAQGAAAAFNAGDQQRAEAHIAQVHKEYEAATSLDAADPQAHLHLAVFLMNTHKYDEAIERFEHARTLIGGNRQADIQIKMNIRRAKLLKVSKGRDEVYQQGQGDMYKAHELMLQQIALTFDPHFVNHDLGTLEVMLCEYNESHCNKSLSRFKAASYATQGHYLQSRMPDKKHAMGCLHSKLAPGNFSDVKEFVDIAEVEALFDSKTQTSVYLNTIKDGTTIHGGDGVITFDGVQHCSVATTSSDFYTNLGRALRAKSPNGERQPPEPPVSLRLSKEKQVLLLTQFSGAAFYHWMCEALPRLLVAKRYLPSFGDYVLLLPSHPNGAPRFVMDTFSSLFPEIRNEMHEHRDMSHVAGASVAITWSPQPCPHNAALRHCASLAHPKALALARDEIVKSISTRRASQQKPYILIAGRGGETRMRVFDESKLRDAVVAASSGLDVVMFDASKQSLEESLGLFHRAAVVVGVHGGALSNIMACTAKTALVEVGFSTIGAQQYAHVAGALGMPYRRVRVEEDPKGRAIGAPSVDFDSAAVTAAVAASVADYRNVASIRDEL